MDNITSPETLDAFVTKIVDGGGNFFKPLSKSDLYKLATRIRELEAEVKQLRNSTAESTSPQMTLFDDHDTTPAQEVMPYAPPCEYDASHASTQEGDMEKAEEKREETADPIAFTDDGRGDRPIPRREAIAERGLDAQAAFDEFLKDRANDPKRYSVMDFSTGKKSVAAAFAFWLTEPN